MQMLKTAIVALVSGVLAVPTYAHQTTHQAPSPKPEQSLKAPDGKAKTKHKQRHESQKPKKDKGKKSSRKDQKPPKHPKKSH